MRCERGPTNIEPKKRSVKNSWHRYPISPAYNKSSSRNFRTDKSCRTCVAEPFGNRNGPIYNPVGGYRSEAKNCLGCHSLPEDRKQRPKRLGLRSRPITPSDKLSHLALTTIQHRTRAKLSSRRIVRYTCAFPKTTSIAQPDLNRLSFSARFHFNENILRSTFTSERRLEPRIAHRTCQRRLYRATIP